MPRWQIENILNIEFAPPSPPLALTVALFSDLITRQRTRRCIQLEVDAAAFIIKHFNLRNTGANMDHARSNKLANKVNKAEAKHMNPWILDSLLPWPCSMCLYFVYLASGTVRTREKRRAAAGHGLESCLVRVWAVLCCAGNVTGKMHFRCTYNLANKFTMANRKLKRAARKSISSWTAAEGQHQGAGSSSSCSSSAADVESGNNNNNNTYWTLNSNAMRK